MAGFCGQETEKLSLSFGYTSSGIWGLQPEDEQGPPAPRHLGPKRRQDAHGEGYFFGFPQEYRSGNNDHLAI